MKLQADKLNDGFDSRDLVFAMSAIGLAGKLAVADGPINLMEVSSFLEAFRIPPEQKQQSLQLFFSAARDTVGVVTFCNFLKKTYPTSRKLFSDLLERLIKISDSDRFLHHKEYRMITEVAALVEVPIGEVQEMLWRHYTKLKYPLTTMLKLPKKATINEIKNSYRLLSRELHPDVYDNGSNKFLEQLAAARFSTITTAYKKLAT